ncbi:hypothetical protein CRYUN_Cryun23aG0131700 [Craigia yunnanensis]
MAVYGLHSCVRDARKSLVRELVTAQEKLDSLTRKWAEEKAKELATAESADCLRVDACRNASVEKESKKASVVSSFEETNEKGNNIKEPDQEYTTHMVDEKSNVKDEETTEPLNVDQALDGKIENENSHADEFVEANGLTREGKPGVVEVNDLILVNNNSTEDKLRSLPKEMINLVDAVCELEKENGNNNDQEIDLLEELLVGIIDEPAISEFEKCEMHETGESNTLSSTEGCLTGRQPDDQLLEATSDICVKGQKENEFSQNPELEMEVEQTQENEVNSDNKFESVLKRKFPRQ